MVSSIALNQGLRNPDIAFSDFFNKRAKYPRFKRKINKCWMHFEWRKTVHSKVQRTISRNLEDKVKSITISKDSVGRFRISFCNWVEIEPLCQVSKSIGIDLGLTDFAVTSDFV